MLWGLSRIRHKVSSVSLHHLGDIATLGMHSRGPSIFGIDPPNTIFRFGSNITFFTWCIQRTQMRYTMQMYECMEVPQMMHHKKASKTSTRSRQHGTQVNLSHAIVTIYQSRTNLSRAPYKSQGCCVNNTHIDIQLINQGHTIQSMHK